MTYVYILLLIIACLVVVFTLTKNAKIKGNKDDLSIFPFYKVRLMTQAEQKLYWHLVKQLTPDYLIFAQVQASRIFRVKKGNNFASWNNRINRLSFDFVVCGKDSMPIVCIELDDSTHDTKQRQETDMKKDKLVQDGGLKIVRWRMNTIPSDILSALDLKKPE